MSSFLSSQTIYATRTRRWYLVSAGVSWEYATLSYTAYSDFLLVYKQPDYYLLWLNTFSCFKSVRQKNEHHAFSRSLHTLSDDIYSLLLVTWNTNCRRDSLCVWLRAFLCCSENITDLAMKLSEKVSSLLTVCQISFIIPS